VVAVGSAYTPDTGGDFALARYIVNPPPPPAHVNGRDLVYNRSGYDGNDPAITDREFNARAIDKHALLPGQAATFDNVSGYSRGINGLLVGFDRWLDSLTAADFAIRVGGGPAGAEWQAAPAPEAFEARLSGNGVQTFAYFTWADGLIKNQWLEVTVLANERTRLAAPDVFYFGSLVGETGDGGGAGATLRVSAVDLGAVKRALNSTSSITGRYDFNRDGKVTAVDLGLVKANLNRPLALGTAVPVQSPTVVPAPVVAGQGGASVQRVWDETTSGLID
jgi:hypothetical protein